MPVYRYKIVQIESTIDESKAVVSQGRPDVFVTVDKPKSQ